MSVFVLFIIHLNTIPVSSQAWPVSFLSQRECQLTAASTHVDSASVKTSCVEVLAPTSFVQENKPKIHAKKTAKKKPR